MEFVTSQAIFDVYDHTTGIVYEPIQICNTKTIKSKTERYCLYAGVKDMIILELKQFKATETIFEWAANVQKQIVP